MSEKSMIKKNRLPDFAVFSLLLLAVSAVTLVLFYRQTTGSPQLYHSDMKAYILEMQGLDSGYSFPYPIFFKLSAFFHLFMGPEAAVAVATMVLNSLAIVVVKLALNELVAKQVNKNCSLTVKMGISVVSISLFFISMLFVPGGFYLPGIHFKYLGVFTANPFHNATYMAARPFALVAFLWFIKLLPVYEQGYCRGDRGVALKDYIVFSVSLLLATMTKPSFTLVMVSTAGLIMLYRLIRSGFKNLIPTVQLGVCFIPTFADLLYQFKGVFVPDEGAERGVGFCFGEVWAQYCSNIPLAVCLAVGFPLLVLVLHLKECKKNSMLLFGWQFFVLGFLEAFLLYEKGFRKFDFNFSWGYMCGIFFCHFASVAFLLGETVRFVGSADKTKGQAGLIIVQWLAYLAHVFCGLLYFRTISSGAMYY